MAFSVLMSLYAKERPEYLEQSLASVFNQTLAPDEVVLVEDGPITVALADVVSKYAIRPELKVVSLQENNGLGIALNEGLKHCSYDLVARMDTDDVCMNDRFAKQCAYMESHPEVSVIGAWIEEFYDQVENVVSVRALPENHEELKVFAASRNPMNHPVVMFRKKAVEACGSFEHFPLFEDYYLWAKMIAAGYKLHNLQEALLWFRSSPDMFRRRGGLSYALKEYRFLKALNKLGVASKGQTLKNMCIRFVVRIQPNYIRGLIYNKLLR